MCNSILCNFVAGFFSYCLSRIEKYNKDCEETELREKLLNENPYYLLDSA
jgi:predicted hydrocarbon binding protein